MMESLFGYAQANPGKNEGTKASASFEATPQYIQIIDAKKSQNLAIILKALNVTTEEVCDALKEGKCSLFLCVSAMSSVRVNLAFLN